MTGPVSADFSAMLSIINSDPDKSIVMSGTSFKSVGKLGAFFTSKTNCRKAADAFLTGIMERYGEAVSVTIAADLRALKTAGKPLSARTARDMLSKAENLSSGLKTINADMAARFLTGSGIKNDNRSLDSAYAECCRLHNLDPDADPALKETFGTIIRQIAASESRRLMTFAEMRDLVIQGELPELRNAIEMSRFLTSQAKQQALASVVREFGFSADQAAELETLVDASMRDFAIQAARKGQMLDEQSIAGAFLENIPLNAFIFANTASSPDILLAGLKDLLGMSAPSPESKQQALALTPALGNGYMSNYLYCMAHMPGIRALQPEGPLTREAIWKGCFGEDLPGNLAFASHRDMNGAFLDKVSARMAEVLGNDPGKLNFCLMSLSFGLKEQKALAAIADPAGTTISKNDFVLPPTLTTIQDLRSLEHNEKQLAIDIGRRGLANAIPGFEPTISFGAAGTNAPDIVRIQDKSALNEQKKALYKSGQPNPVTHSIVDKARALCGGNELQLRQVIISLSQAGIMPLRQISPLTGHPLSEHSPVHIDVRREQGGAISIRYRTPEASPVDADYTFTVGTDGYVALSDMTIRARRTGA